MTPERAGLGLVWRLGTATTLTVMSFAMVSPVLAVLLQQRGYGTTVIGAFSMLAFLLIGVLIPVVPRVIGRLGVVRTYRTGAALELVGVVGYALGDSLAAWSAAEVLVGIGAALLWNATEALLAQEAPPKMRGRVMGLYQTALGAALALGPFLPVLLRLQARAALWLAAAAVAVCLVIALLVRSKSTPPAAQAHASAWEALRAVPWLTALAFAGGVFEAGLSAIEAAHASSLGLDLRSAATVAGAIGVGSFLVQYPAGWSADHMPVRRVFGGAAVALALASVAVGFAGSAHWLLWACGLVFGGAGGALYTVAIVQVAHAYAGRATAGGAAAVITGYTWGGTLGPLVSGVALQAGGLPAFAGVLTVLAVATLVAAGKAGTVRGAQRAAHPT
ncbi:MFS transporter [Ramlibacter sp. G-1-2-2]|uniref:MFS transporter n=1 Tax=Ramlibacter agri TaxID=2728837 RepID=A0A848HA62_9BURK|nr:MFS transporter [Ramlibacter agri]NML47374.1 MFS transporter [Ramlibacter agri]